MKTIMYLLIFCFSPFAISAVDMFIKIEGIDGESVDDKHKEWIEILAMQYQQETTFKKNKQLVNRSKCPDIATISFVKKMDSASPQLADNARSGINLGKAEIHWIQTAAPSPTDPTVPIEYYMTYALNDVIITSYSINASANDENAPSEKVTITFSDVKWEYDKEVKDGIGSVPGHWDMKNKCKG